MGRDKYEYSHGDTGQQPSALDFQENERPDAQHFDWWWYTTTQYVNSHADEFDRLDSDDDGVVDEADYANDADASTFKGNDIDDDGDGVVDQADYANDADASTFKGNDIDSDGDGIVDEADTVQLANDSEAVNGNSLKVQSWEQQVSDGETNKKISTVQLDDVSQILGTAIYLADPDTNNVSFESCGINLTTDPNSFENVSSSTDIAYAEVVGSSFGHFLNFYLGNFSGSTYTVEVSVIYIE